MNNNLKPMLGMIEFPGSNCDLDCREAFKEQFGLDIVPIWHQETKLPPIKGIVLPGGFSYGDYLRAGHLACLSPIMPAVLNFAKKGGAILGICNGFQILTELSLLPGALLPNENAKFLCHQVELISSEAGPSPYQHKAAINSTIRLPIAHKEGRYFISSDGLKKLQDLQQIVFRYKNNPNGSIFDIAGVCSENGRILGMMPHPERATDHLLGSTDGIQILGRFLASFM